MAKFRSRPAEIEAEQFVAYSDRWPPGVQVEEGEAPFVVTAHGQRVYLEGGEWIVKEPTGDGYYPVKPDIFEKRWELIPSGA